MLRRHQVSSCLSSACCRGRFTAVLFASGIVVTGLCSVEPQIVWAQPRSSTAATDGFNLENVPASTTVLLGIRPAQMAARDELKEIVKLVDDMFGDNQQRPEAKDIDQVLVIFLPSAGALGQGEPVRGPVLEVRLTRPTDLEVPIKAFLGGGDVSLQSAGDEVVWAHSNQEVTSGSTVAYAVNSRTFLMGQSEDVLSVVATKQRSDEQPHWVKEFAEVATEDLCGVVNIAAFRPFLQGLFAEDPNPIVGMFVPLWENTDLIVGGARLDDKLAINVHVWSKNAKGATKVEERLTALIPLAQGLLESSRLSIRQSPNELRPLLEQSADVAEEALKNLSIQTADDRVTVSLSTDAGSLATIAKAMLPSVQKARSAGRQTQSRNNLKQIALALHNYHDVYGHFPPQVLLGPDGKTKYSWRVAILPFLDEKALYEQYDQTQPWDSEDNLKVLAQMPPALRHPNDAAGSTNTSYFVLVGEHTVASDKPGEGHGIRTITDGTSNTIMTVEAKRDIPWTNPEDIPIDAEKAIPQLGGFFQGGYNVGMADGSVQFISDQIEKTLLRSLITRDGGELLEIP